MIFIFRNPAERLFSFMREKKANTYLSGNITFKDFVEHSIKWQMWNWMITVMMRRQFYSRHS
jgi:hypothetical protein